MRTLPDGGVEVVLRVPTYSGGATFTLHTERDADGDWRVFVPWPDSLDEHQDTLDGMDVVNGIVYVGAPDVPVPATWDR